MSIGARSRARRSTSAITIRSSPDPRRPTGGCQDRRRSQVVPAGQVHRMALEVPWTTTSWVGSSTSTSGRTTTRSTGPSGRTWSANDHARGDRLAHRPHLLCTLAALTHGLHHLSLRLLLPAAGALLFTTPCKGSAGRPAHQTAAPPWCSTPSWSSPATIFYGWWNPWFIFLMLGITVVNYVCGRIIGLPGAGSPTADLGRDRRHLSSAWARSGSSSISCSSRPT